MSDIVNFAPSELTPEQSVVLSRAGYRDRLTYWSVINCLQPCWVMWYNPDPGCACISRGKRYELTGDKILLIPPHTLYSGEHSQAPRHYFIWFQASAPFDLPQRQVIELPAAPFINRIHAAFAPGERRLQQIYTLVYELLLSIPENFFSHSNSPGKDLVINQAIRYINRNDGCVCNADIAAELHISPTRFCHLFKAEMGIPPQRYCRQVRMYKAISLLQEGVDIKTAAGLCGFADRYHFSKEFKIYHNISPGKWLRTHRRIMDKKSCGS